VISVVDLKNGLFIPNTAVGSGSQHSERPLMALWRKQMKTILKALVGSRAHGLHNDKSDFDYRGVFVVPTSTILSLGYKEKATSWLEGQGEDATSYELHHFLNLATRSNPSILEVLVSPVTEDTIEGATLRALFPYVWNSKDVLNSFVGYGKNQQKKYLDNKDNRPGKYACAYLRVLLLGIELLKYGTMTVDIAKQQDILGLNLPDLTGRSNKQILLEVKNNMFSKGTVINWAEEFMEIIKSYADNSNKETDMNKVNDFLLETRKANW
jgi:hypothetical protein